MLFLSFTFKKNQGLKAKSIYSSKSNYTLMIINLNLLRYCVGKDSLKRYDRKAHFLGLVLKNLENIYFETY